MITQLPAHQQRALHATLAYWLAHWDGECPVLFGLQRATLEQILAAWPACAETRPSEVAQALLCGIRELLDGASALSPVAVAERTGVSADELGACLKRIRPWIDQVSQP